MNRLVGALFIGVVGSFSFGCSSTGIGDPCTPESEFDPQSGASQLNDLNIDLNSTQCDTRVCLSHYFQGRVTCPFGNGTTTGQDNGTDSATDCTGAPKCLAVDGHKGLFTLDGMATGTLCCPLVGDTCQRPLALPVPGQCASRPKEDAVYCSCRCGVPDDPEIDKSQVTLCSCGDGFSCVPLCDQTHGGCGLVPKGKWGSYCVKNGPLGADLKDNDAARTAACGPELAP